MQDKCLYEYAVLRLVPRVEREEFINIGILLFCKRSDYIGLLAKLDTEKTKSLFPSINIDEVEPYLDAIRLIVNADENGGPIARFDVASRFRWLTAKRSTIIQTSATHSGFSEDLNATLQKLYLDFVDQ
jgi:Protein of unknown function (DUF3037)